MMNGEKDENGQEEQVKVPSAEENVPRSNGPEHGSDLGKETTDEPSTEQAQVQAQTPSSDSGKEATAEPSAEQNDAPEESAPQPNGPAPGSDSGKKATAASATAEPSTEQAQTEPSSEKSVPPPEAPAAGPDSGKEDAAMDASSTKETHAPEESAPPQPEEAPSPGSDAEEKEEEAATVTPASPSPQPEEAPAPGSDAGKKEEAAATVTPASPTTTPTRSSARIRQQKKRKVPPAEVTPAASPSRRGRGRGRPKRGASASSSPPPRASARLREKRKTPPAEAEPASSSSSSRRAKKAAKIKVGEGEDPHEHIGLRVAKDFDGEIYYGNVTEYDINTRGKNGLWHVKYDDGDEEDFNARDLRRGLRLYHKKGDEDPKVVKEKEELEAMQEDVSESNYQNGDRVATPFGNGSVRMFRESDGFYEVLLTDWKTKGGSSAVAFLQKDALKGLPKPDYQDGDRVATSFGNGSVRKFRETDGFYEVLLTDWKMKGGSSPVAFLQKDALKGLPKPEYQDGDTVTTSYGNGSLRKFRETDGFYEVLLTDWKMKDGSSAVAYLQKDFLEDASKFDYKEGDSVVTSYGTGSVRKFRETDGFYEISLTDWKMKDGSSPMAYLQKDALSSRLAKG